MKKASDNPLHRANAAPRFSAKAKHSGLPCQTPAVRGRTRCTFTGSTARISSPAKGASHGRYSHGQFTCQAVEQRQALALLIRMARQSAFEL